MKDHEEQYTLITRAGDVLEQMIAELRIRGCRDTDRPVSDALDLVPRLEAMGNRLAGLLNTRETGQKPASAPEKLHQLDAGTVNTLDLNDMDNLDLAPHSREDLVEAAFTFENELMALLGDDNAMAWDAYSELPADQLIRIIQSAVENICRIQSGK
ncbi:MAG: hypothetical protein MI863_12615 [Desulfobacterales bacterium]|nr:hypothetical protein [Desulfobacterales bacterium]